jgi:type VI secretion system protein ImpI
MPLHLKIENYPSLPDGGPIAYTVGRGRGVDIGRDQYLDWVLPDPDRFVSGKHCEIRYRDGGYWLTDVSTNGTFLNGNQFRMQGAHQLRTGDRIEVGPYIITSIVEPDAMTGDDLAQMAGEQAMRGPSGLWSVGEEVAPPINPRELRKPSISAGVNSGDFFDWAADIGAPPPPMAMPAEADSGIRPRLPRAGNPFAEPAPPPAAYAPPVAPAPAMPAPPPMPAPPSPTPAPPPAMAQATAADPSAAPRLPKAGEPLAWDIEDEPEAAQRVEPPQAAEAVAPPPPPPMPTAEPPPVAPRPASVGAGTGVGEFRRRFAKGAGIPVESVAARDDGDLAEQLGQLMASISEHLRQLQAARAQFKSMIRSSSHTMVQATENNPLRFLPTAQEALRVMFGPSSGGYQSARPAIEGAFADLKRHQLTTVTALQAALIQLLADLDPETVEKVFAAEKSGGLLSSRKAKLWETYVTIWEAKSGRSKQGMINQFMVLFAEAYDKAK